MRVGLIVPTLNAGVRWPAWLTALQSQTRQPDAVLVVDSISDDDTVILARAAGLRVAQLPRASFDHGATRQWAIDQLGDCEVVVCLTQDAILATPDALQQLLSAFSDPAVGMAWGRQLPHSDASPIAAHARSFNYPAQSRTVSLADKATLGLKTAFCSNSFAAWRCQALREVGGFPRQVLMCEDMLACAKLLQQGWRVSYVAESAVLHSHNYRVSEEFRRYFDIGALHAMAPWLRAEFGQASGEGKRFVRAELAYLRPHGWRWQCHALLRSAVKLLGFQLGLRHARLPRTLQAQCSLHRGWWKKAPVALKAR